jgi:hypothetical protein
MPRTSWDIYVENIEMANEYRHIHFFIDQDMHADPVPWGVHGTFTHQREPGLDNTEPPLVIPLRPPGGPLDPPELVSLPSLQPAGNFEDPPPPPRRRRALAGAAG